jgi:SNF2 family DNA or RNA helicase
MGGYENKQIVGYSNVEELMKLIQPFTLEVDKKILNLPPKIYKTRIIKASPEQQKLFDKILSGLEKEEQNPVEAWIKTQNVLERMLRLQQVIGGFEPRTDRETEVTLTYPLATNPKLDDLKEFIDDNFEGTKFVVWARYIPEIELITASLRQKYGAAAVVDYYGATSSADRTIAEDRYCNDPTCRFLVGNPAAAGLGLTFVSGENDVMYYYSGTFAYIDRTQSEDRSHRIGQQHTTVVVDPIMEGTLDEAIAASIKEKKSMDQFVKDWISAGKSVRDLVHGVGL